MSIIIPPPSKEKHITRSKKSKKVIDCFFALFIFCTVLFGGTVNNATTVQAANFPSRVVNIGGAITLQGSYSVSVWRSGSTVYCKVHVDVSAPNGAYLGMGASMSTNHGSNSKTFVGNGGATPKRGSGDIQISFTDSGAGTVSGTIYAGFIGYLNSTYALTANFSTSYPTSNIDSTVPKNNASGNITYVSHVENIGWQSWVADGATSGTVGKKLQMETIAIDSKLVGLSYEVHVAEKGWMSAKTNGHAAGTIGQSLAIQAIKIKLTGNNATRYTLKYRAHVAEKGWMNWVNAGEVAGTTGQSLDMQAIEIKLIPNTYTLKITGDSGVESISGNGSYSAGSTAHPTYKIKTGYHVTNIDGQGQDAGSSWSQHNNKVGTINGSWNMTHNISAYISTAPNKVSIAYHINGGTVNSSTYSINQYGYVQNSSGPWFHKISYGSSDDLYNASTFGLTKTGYSFIGWENSNTGTFYDQDTQYGSAQYYGKSTSDTTETAASVDCYLKAKWKINTYTVSINPNGGSYNGTTGITKINQAQGKTVEINQIPTRKGYTFVGWTRSGSGSLHSGNSDNRSGITQYEKADADGTAYTNYKMNFNNTTNAGYAYPSIQYFSYGYTSGHTYRLSVDVRVNKSSGNEYAHIRHSAFVNNWVAPSTTVNYLTNGWEHRTVERTFTGTTSEQNGTSQNIYPFVEFYAGVAGGKTGVLDFDMKNLTIYDVTAGNYITSNYSNIKNGATVDVGKGDTTITAVWVPNNTIYYKAGKGGAVSRTSEPVEGYKDALGSYARVNTGYKFDGWYGSGVKVSSNANFVPGNPNNSLEQPLRSGNYGGEVLSYDSTNKIYTIKANASNMNSSWGSGVSPSIASNDIIPWGKYFTATFDVWSPIDAKIQVDINNATVDGVNASGNDNDTNRGGTTAISLKANTWTTVSFWYQNASSTNSSQAALRNYSSIGLIWDTSKGDQNFKIRNYQTMVSNNVVGSAREYEARFVPIPYQQTVRVRFENTDGSFTNYSQAYQANHNYDSTFEWEFPASQQYESTKISYKVTGAKSTDVTVYRKKYTVKVLTKTQKLDGTWPDSYSDVSSRYVKSSYRYGEECRNQIMIAGAPDTEYPYWETFMVTENKELKYDLKRYKNTLKIYATLSDKIDEERENKYFTFDFYVADKLVRQSVYNVNDVSIYYGNNYTIKNIQPRNGYHYTNMYFFRNPIHNFGKPTKDENGVFNGYFSGESTYQYSLCISPNTYTINYNGNGATGGATTSSSHTYNDSKALTKNGFIRTGYSFKGWATNADGSGTTYSDEQEVRNLSTKNGDNVTLYAQWTPNSYYLDLNGYLDGVGSGSISGYGTADIYVNGKLVADDVSDYCSQIPYGSTYEIKDIKTKSGRVYNGVHSGKLSGTMGADRVNVYLSFSTKVITTTFHRNIGDSDTTTTTQNFKYGQSGQAFNANTWSRTGYTFLGWSTNKNATSMTYPDKCGVADSWIDSNYPSINLYAVWSLNTYSISYNLNGGSISGQKTSYNVNTDTFTLPIPTKTGYTFTGWTGSNGTTPQKNVTISKGSTGSKSYTANWSINSYTLTVNPNGGLWNGSSSSQNIAQNYNTIKSISVPTRTGYTFLRWDLKGSGTLNNRITSDPYFTSGMGGISTYNNNGDGKVALTRQTKSSDNTFGSNYEIKIDVKGANNPGYGGFYHGITSVANTKYVHSFIAKLPKGTTLAIAHNPVGDDYSKRWLTSNVGTGAWQVYAYEMNTGSKGTFSTFGHVYVSSSTTSAFTWYLAASQITTVSSNATYTYGAGNGTLVAQWTPNRYTVTYNPNKGSGSMSPDTVTYGTAYKTKKNTFTRTGYTFNGWNEKADSTGTAWSLSSSGVYEANKTWTWTYTHDITLYAQWKPNNYTYNIKYVSSSGKDLGHDTVTGTFDTSKTVTPPAKTGYTTPVAQTVKFDSTSAKTITFTYPLISYTISYDVNGGNTLSGQRTSYNIESSAYTLPVPSRTGHTFTGWTGSNGTAPQKSVTIAAGSTGNKSYKANWTINSYTNSIDHWAGGFKNKEGNNSSKSWFALRTTTFNKNYGETFSMNDSLATAIPNGFYLMSKFGTSSLEGTWKTYEKPYSITQPAKDMSFEYDYYPYDYSITYNLDGGTNNSANPSKYNVLYGVSLKNPTKTGYTFLGWYDNANLIINKKYEIANDTTVNGNNYVFKNTTNGNTLNAFQIQTWKDGTYLETFAGGSQTGTRQEKYTHNRDTGNYTIRLKANGSTKDSSVYYYDVYLEKGKTYSISYNIEKCTSSEVVVKNLSFTRSDKVTGINEGANATFTSSDELYAKLKNRQTGNINLTAKWTPNEYTLTLNPNGGNIKGNTNAQSLNPSLYYDRGNWWYVGSMSPSRAGYSFNGWFDAPSGGIKVYDSEGNCTNDGKYWKNKQYKYLSNLTVYAQWTPNSYTYNIKYVSSSNKSLGSDTVTGIFDTSKTVTPPAKTGYTTPASQTVKFDSTNAKTITFTYQLINYSISYDVNGGTALSNPRTSYNVESSAYTLPITSRTGYTFTGWTGSNGNTPQKSVTIAAGSTGNKSYKANWKANSLTIRYHSNGAFGGNKYENSSWKNDIVFDYGQSTDTVVYIQNLEEGSAANSGLQTYGVYDYSWKRKNDIYMYKNGYIGTGKYNTKPNSSGIEIDENKTFNSVIELANYLGVSIDSKDNSIDLYPQWKAISYSIVYNGNGATSGNMTEQPATFDRNIELVPNSFSRKYTVTYNATGGTINAPNNVATSTFNGWEDRGNISFMDKNYSYNDFDAPYYSQNYTDLNAAFGFNKYNLIKHYFLYGKSEGRNPKDKTGNAGLYPNKATVKNMTITNGYKVNLYANWKLGSVTLPTPTRFGYKFLGWYTSAEGGTKIAGATYTPTSNVTLYAHWKLDSYYIDYNVNDTGLTDRITDNLSDNNGSLPGKDTAVMLTDFALQNGSKYNTKYTFKEWNTKPDGSGQKFTTSITNDGSLCKPGETLTLYAQWNTTPTITGKDFYMLENMKPASDILTSGKGLDKNPIDHFPDNMKDVVYPVKGYTKNGTDISSRIKVDYVEYDGSKTATASIDTKKPGKYTVHYSLTDGKQTKKFTRTITVLSASTPVINAGDRYFNKGSFVTAEMLLSTITSGDRYDGDLTNKVAVLNMEQIAFNTVGNYDIQYKVTNRSGKTVVKKVKIHILEYLTDNQADKDNKYRYIRKDCSTKNDYCMEYFKEDSKWVTNDELNNQIIDSLSKDKSEEAIKKYHFSQDDVKRSK